MALTSRERVVSAIEHREPDRVPIDFNPVPDFYVKLKAHLGLEIDEQMDVGTMEEAIPHPHVLTALGADLISVKLASSKKSKRPPATGDKVVDAWGVGLKRVHQKGGGCGGYILAPSHYVQADTAPENLIAMCEAAKEYGRYPLNLRTSASGRRESCTGTVRVSG